VKEKTIESYLVGKVKALGGEVRKVQFPGHRGAPDRFVMTPYGTAWVELKAPGKKAEAHQAREHEAMRAMHQFVVVVDSLIGVDDLIRRLYERRIAPVSMDDGRAHPPA